MDSTLEDGFIPPTRLVVLNPIVRRSIALLRGSLGPNTQQHLSVINKVKGNGWLLLCICSNDFSLTTLMQM